MTAPDRSAPTLEQQADMMAYLLHRCVGGLKPNERFADALLTLRAEDLEDLKHIERRLRLMAPHEKEIRAVVGRARR